MSTDPQNGTEIDAGSDTDNDIENDIENGELIGCVGNPWRATVDPAGNLIPWDGSAPLEWHIAAGSRWYSPGRESSTRQRRIDGTPVIETGMKVPGGYVFQRTFDTMHRGGMAVVEVNNESALPVAVAFTRSDVLSFRTPTEVPIQGIELPPTTITFPVGHKTTVIIGVPHRDPAAGPLPAGMPDAELVKKGWLKTCDLASRFELPEPGLADRVTAVRCDALLRPLPDPNEDPAEFLVTLGELARIGEPVDPLLAEVAAAAERVLRARSASWRDHRAVIATQRMLELVGEERALGDVRRALAGAPEVADRPERAPEGIWLVPWLEEFLVGADGAVLPHGLPAHWIGGGIDAHDVPIAAGKVSFALRWHGRQPSVMWETDPGVRLSAPELAPSWSTSEPMGEVEWPEIGTHTHA